MCIDQVNSVFNGPQGTGKHGINVQAVVAALDRRFTERKVLEAVETLLNLGQLYRTVDNAHFRSSAFNR